MNDNVYQITLLVIVMSCLGGIFFMSLNQCEKCSACEDINIVCDRYLMENENLFYEKSYVNGIYWHPTHYCVWTKDRTVEEINKTDCHEVCHKLVKEQEEHFCGDIND